MVCFGAENFLPTLARKSKNVRRNFYIYKWSVAVDKLIEEKAESMNPVLINPAIERTRGKLLCDL